MVREAALAVLLGGFAAAVSGQGFGDAEARFNIAVTHLREGRVDLAIDEFKKAIKLDPKNPYFRKGLGLAYAQKGQFDESVAELRKALQLNPHFVDVHNDLGSVLALAGKREEGKKEFFAGYNDPMNPTPEISAYNMGNTYLEEKNYPEAVNWFRTSLARNKTYAQPYLGMADALEAQGRAEEALAQLENGVKEVPGDAALRLALGRRYLNAGRFAESRAELEAAVKKDPGGPAGQQAAALLKDLPK